MAAYLRWWHMHYTAAAWTAANTVLLAGEVGIETDTRKQKYGDGTTAWVSLPYAGGATSILTGLSLASSAVIAAADTILAALGQLQAQITLRATTAYVDQSGTLSSLGAATIGRKAVVTDGTTTLAAGIGAIVVGGGANKAPVWADGTNWRYG